MIRYTVIPSRCWKHKNGHTASLTGAAPWHTRADKAYWSLETRGYTIQDNQTGTIGLGRKPFATEAEAQAHADLLNAR